MEHANSSASYKWKEDKDSITLSIPFVGKSLKRTDLVTFDTLVKVSHPPYRLEINLKHSINDTLSRATLKDQTLTIYLRKEVSELWGTLEFQGTKEECKERRRISLLKREEKTQLRHQNAVMKKSEERRSTVQSQMTLEKFERKRLDDMKALHKQKAEDEVYETLSKLPISTLTKKEFSSLILESKENSSFSDGFDLPPVRTRSIVSMTNTPRWFQTPSRESTVEKEEKFLAKYPSLFTKNLSSSEENLPLQLQEKAGIFHKNKDYLSAINAYTPLLQYNDSKLHALVHRSECYLCIGDISACINDCERLLQVVHDDRELMSAQNENANQLRGSIYVRIARAFCQYNTTTTNFDKALDYLKLAQDNSHGMKMDQYIYRVKNLQLAHHAKKDGDTMVEMGCNESAIVKYQEALSIDGTFFTAAANMTAVTLTLGKYGECVDYCTQVLELFTKDIKWSESDGWYIPSPASKIRGTVIATIESRRNVALKELALTEVGHLESNNSTRSLVSIMG